MKIFFIIIGVVSLVLGIIGIAVPLLPTTPFLLLSATLFIHSSPKLHNWLISNKLLGKYIIDYREHRSMPLRAKCTSITLLWVSIIYSIIYIAERLWLDSLLLIIAITVTCHILSLNTTPRERE